VASVLPVVDCVFDCTVSLTLLSNLLQKLLGTAEKFTTVGVPFSPQGTRSTIIGGIPAIARG
jgi:hypothetical protein